MLSSGLHGNPSAKGHLARLCPHSRWCEVLQELLPSAKGPEATKRLSRKVEKMGSALAALGAETIKSQSDGIHSRGCSFLLAPGLCLEPWWLARKRTRSLILDGSQGWRTWLPDRNQEKKSPGALGGPDSRSLLLSSLGAVLLPSVSVCVCYSLLKVIPGQTHAPDLAKFFFNQLPASQTQFPAQRELQRSAESIRAGEAMLDTLPSPRPRGSGVK